MKVKIYDVRNEDEKEILELDREQFKEKIIEWLEKTGEVTIIQNADNEFSLLPDYDVLEGIRTQKFRE